jgi:type II secretory pathway pseudopilin PulG
MRRRAGFTVVELLIVVVMVGIVGGTLMRVIQRQQRFYSGVTQVIDQRSQLRQAASILPAEIRGISTIGGDVVAFSDSALEMSVTIGSSIVCGINADRKKVWLLPTTVSTGQATGGFLYTPQSGDAMYFYDDGIASGTEQWEKITVNTFTPTTLFCTATPYTTGADAAKNRYEVVFTGTDTITTNILVGTPVRFTRRVRYALYQAANSQWYLGFSEWNGATYSTLEPVSGPYRSYASGAGASGLSFKYYDEAGSAVTTMAAATTIARVDLVIRGQTKNSIRVDGMQRGNFKDSLVVKIAIRNRS